MDVYSGTRELPRLGEPRSWSRLRANQISAIRENLGMHHIPGSQVSISSLVEPTRVMEGSYCRPNAISGT